MASRLQPVEAPQARPPRFGLIAAAPRIEDGERWQAGFSFEPEACGSSGRLPVLCDDGGNAEMDSQRGPGVVRSDPFLVWAADECTTFGMEARDWQGRARRQLAADESFQIAAELWGGSLTLEHGTSLASDTAIEVNNAPADPVDALAALEAGMAQCNRGRQGMVHLTPQVLTLLVAESAVRLDGNTYVSPNGHIVVPDAGYDGSAPDGAPAGASQFMYGTSMIGVRLSDVTVTPPSLADARDLAQALNRAVNTIVVYAQRLAAWQWDECCHLAAEVDVAAVVLPAS